VLRALIRLQRFVDIVNLWQDLRTSSDYPIDVVMGQIYFLSLISTRSLF
jgi:hypothetical protein